jgi:hypothetical protein
VLDGAGANVSLTDWLTDSDTVAGRSFFRRAITDRADSITGLLLLLPILRI